MLIVVLYDRIPNLDVLKDAPKVVDLVYESSGIICGSSTEKVLFPNLMVIF